LFGTQSTIVAAFLSENYCGSDWRLGRCTWIGGYLRDPDVIALGLFAGEKLIATIFSVPIGNTRMSHGGSVSDLRMIEGLCVAAPYRSNGIAGYMIAKMDDLTSSHRPATHLWCREVPSASLWDTALRTDIYGFRKTGDARIPGPGLEEMPWDAFSRLWIASSPTWTLQPSIIVKQPTNRKNSIRIFHGYRCIVAIADTGRQGADEIIYEIVWSGKYTNGVLMPATTDLDFKQLLDDVACALPPRGVLFGTSSPDCGGVDHTWDGWTVGRSGAHAMYIYNYMPPAFGSCRILMVRDEI